MSSFLEYVPGTSPLHRMNPVAKLAAAAAFALACFCSSNLAFLAVLLAAGFALAATCGMVRPAIGLAKAVFAFSLILAVVQVLTTPSGAVLVELPWGYVGTGSLLAALTTVVRLVVKVLHVPYKYAFTFTSTIHFIPMFMNDMKGIMEAQTARGVEFDAGGIVRKVRLMVPLCVPLLVSSVRKTNSAAIAAEVRGFNLRTAASGYKEYPFVAADVAAMAGSLALVAIAVALGVLL